MPAVANGGRQAVPGRSGRRGALMAGLRAFLPRRFARLVATLGLIGYLAGSVTALLVAAPELLQRFGAIGVAAAILFFDDRLMEVELQRQQSVERILREYGLELEVMKEGIDPKAMPPTGYLVDYLREEARLHALRRHAARISAINIFLLTIATLQWGFGDAFLRWVLA